MFKKMRKKFNITDVEWSWIKYDIANSAFVLTVITVLFPLLNGEVAAASGISDQVRSYTFSYLIAGLSLLVAIISPFLGALANYEGNKMKFFKFFVIMGVAAGGLLCIPTLSWVPLCAVYAISYIGYNGANIFYDSFLVDVSPDEERSDQVSAYGFSFGYIGSMIPFTIGIIPFALQLTGLVQFQDLLGMSEYMAIRLTYSFAIIITVVWWYFNSKDMFQNVEQKYSIKKPEQPIKEAWNNIRETGKDVKSYKNVFLFLIAYVLYMDVTSGLIKTVANMIQDFNINQMSMLLVIIIIQLVAFPCAIIFGNLAKKHGPKKMIYVGMAIYAVVIGAALFMSPERSWLLYVIGILVGFAQGGIQAVSRSFFARLVPREKANEFFGFYGIFSKFSGIISPFLYGVVMQVSGNNVLGLSMFFIPLIAGAIVFKFVKNEKAICPTAEVQA